MKHRTWSMVAVACVILDRVLKWYAQSLPDGTAFSFFPGLDFGYFLNPALFFFPAWRWIPWVALVVLLMLTTYYLLRSTSSRDTFVMILLGGLSNVFDRFVYGGVIDYVHILGIATINLADILIFMGLLILISQPYVKRG